MRRLTLVFLIAVVLFASAVSADPIVLSGSSGWNSWTAGQLSGGPFWANRSYDGNGSCNIGYYVSGVSGCNVAGFYNGSPNSFLPYLGNGDSTFSFSGNDMVTVTLNTGTTADRMDTFGWYNLNDPTNLHQLFGVDDTRGGSASFSPNGAYGFYFSTSYGSFLSTGTDAYGLSHFALFNAKDGNYFLGMEDRTRVHNGDHDYQDMGVTIQSQPVPEPASLLLLGTGILLGATRLKRRRG